MRIASVGDIAFTGAHSDNARGEAFKSLGEIFAQIDLLIGNLESPLTTVLEAQWGKCTLRGDPGWAGVLKEAGFNVLSLANNHLMDYGERGLLDTMEVLRDADIYFLGAGKNRGEACAPLFLSVQGQRVAFLARTQVIVTSPSFAGDARPGVAWLDEAETLSAIAVARARADIVVLLLHWGIENYSYPSPEQRRLARLFTEAGCSLILGHHPHVLQGVERVGKSLVSYSLGNFLFDDFEWEFRVKGQPSQRFFQPLAPRQRESMVLQVEFEGGSVSQVIPQFACIGVDGLIRPDQSDFRQRNYDRLCSGLRLPVYSICWRSYSLWREWQLRIRPLLFPKGFLKKLGRIRFQHLIELSRRILKTIQLVSGKTTNPYK